MSAARRVVVTGVGAITPLGLDGEELWKGLRAGRSGVRRVSELEIDGLPTQIAAVVDGFEPERWIGRKEARRMDRTAQFAVAAARQALADSRIDLDREDRARIGASVGTGMGGLRSFEAEYQAFLTDGPRRISPFLVSMTIPNTPSGQISIELGLRGPSHCVATACATGTDSIGDAFTIIRRGGADVMFAGGVESAVTPFIVGAFCACKTLSRRNDEPTRASRPFDRDRDGFVIGEGVGVVVLEERDRAIARGAAIYGEVVGYGATSDAIHITAPDETGEGMARAMTAALDQAGLPPSAVDYLNAHGTSTPLNDRCETLAIKRAFGDHAEKLAISSTKSMVGHLVGAAGAVELIATLFTLRDGYIHPTINLDSPDPQCDLDYVPREGRHQSVSVAMSNSLAFGGHNASIVVARAEAV